jgi:polyphenol oxidase
MLFTPNWSAPSSIRAAMTTRVGGVSVAPFDSLNLGYSTADDRNAVAENERRVAAALGVHASNFRWVHQVHGNVVHHAETLPANDPIGTTTIQGDAIVSRTRGIVCGVKVADCMPVLFAADDGSVVGAAHAGWRGLSSGIIENTIHAMNIRAENVVAWIGPCIGAAMFEVGEDVRAAFLDQADQESVATIENAFAPREIAGKYLCNLVAIARERLRVAGVTRVSVSGACTMSEPLRFFSHRRDKSTGRMAAFVGISE